MVIPRWRSSGAESIDAKSRCSLRVRVLVVQHLGNGGSQRRLTVVNVTNGADVDVRLSPLELCLCHRFLLERFQVSCSSAALFAAETPASLLGGFGFGEIADSGTNLGTWSLFAQGPDCGSRLQPGACD